jgi:ParB family chromosome partitioning protein
MGETDDVALLREVAIDVIEPNPNQPRVHFDEAALSELTASIREVGVLQPVLVRPVGDRYQLIAGERRWRAARQAGLRVIPALVRESDDLGAVEQALVENLHREDLSALEEAAAYQQLIEDFELTHDEVAARVGKSRATVTNTLRLLQLSPSIQHLLAQGRLSAGHARAVLGAPDRVTQESLARRAADEGWSVRAVEDAVRASTQPVLTLAPAPAGRPTPERTTLRPPGLLELEGLLSDYLDTRVSVAMGNRKGKVTIEFATLEDLERLYRLITEAPPA